jgi:cephalosporin hydroxylase
MTAVDDFHQLYYDTGLQGGTWTTTTWLGVGVLKCPLDLWEYQEIIYELRPDLIVETGTAKGGSALYFASVCDLIGNGDILTIDIAHASALPQHPRITYLTGSSVDPSVVAQVYERAGQANTVMVVLDSDHSAAHVAAELDAYAPIVTHGSYLVVEDTNVNGHPVYGWHGPGPMEAVEQFLAGTAEFVADRSREKLLLTFNPSGWLQRTATG